MVSELLEKVTIGLEISDTVPVVIGIAQGTVLGPIFSISLYIKVYSKCQIVTFC